MPHKIFPPGRIMFTHHRVPGAGRTDLPLKIEHAALAVPWEDLVRHRTPGIYNAVVAYRGSTPRLTLSLSIMQLVDRTHGPGGPIEHDVGVFTVANTGSVPVLATLAYVEVVTGRDLLLVSPMPLDDGPWPREVQPGHAVQLRFDVDSMARELERVVAKRPAIKTAVGTVLFGKEDAMAGFHRALVQYKIRGSTGGLNT